MQTYFDQTSRDFRNGFAQKVKTFDLEGQHRFKLTSGQELIYGAGLRTIEHDVENLELFGFLPAHKSLLLLNIFIQDDITLIKERLRVIAGIKVENYTYSGFQYQPNIRLNFQPGKDQTVWAAVSRAIRNPSRIDREFFVSFAPGVPFIIGNDAKPEDLLSYELGWHSQIAKSLTLSLSTYYNQYDNIRGVAPAQSNADVPVIFTNAVEGSSHGAELAFTYQVARWWRIRGGYNFFEKDLSVKKGLQDRNNASAESNDPTHQVLLQSIISMQDKIEIGAVARYVSQLPEPKVSEYVGLDLRMGYSITKNIQLNVVGQNLLQKNHIEFIPDSPEPKAIERSLYVKAALRF